MGKPVTSNVKRLETTTLNTKINKEVFEAFKDCCAEFGYSMNIILETFMRQYSNGRFELSDEDIMKFKGDKKEVGTFNTTFNKDIYNEFKEVCRKNGYFLRHVVTAFMEKFAERNIILEYVNISDIENGK